MTPLIRPASVADAEGIARVHVDVWRSTYRGIMPDKVLDGLTYEQRAKTRREHLEKNDPRCCCFVAQDENKNIIGFAMGGPRREGNEQYDGELYAIYLFKEHQGKGIGRALFLQVAEWLASRSYKSMLIWVLKDNPTRRFYEAMGGQNLESKIIEIGAPLDEVSYGWPDLSSLLKRNMNLISRFEIKGLFLCRDGKARDISESHSNKKLCFVSTDKNILMQCLVELSEVDGCFFVKLSAEPKDGMYLGRCFFATDQLVGEYWAKYKLHPKLMCNIQDDDFSKQFREMVVRHV